LTVWTVLGFPNSPAQSIKKGSLMKSHFSILACCSFLLLGSVCVIALDTGHAFPTSPTVHDLSVKGSRTPKPAIGIESILDEDGPGVGGGYLVDDGPGAGGGYLVDDGPGAGGGYLVDDGPGNGGGYFCCVQPHKNGKVS
jgi:hypothetical protein